MKIVGAIVLVFALLVRADDRPGRIETLPTARGGQELVGQAFPALEFSRWLNTEKNQPLETAGSVTLYRWWTDTCPYCEVTLPAIEKLRDRYAVRGLKVVAVYHPKPAGDVKDETVLAAARSRHYQGAVAVDPEWAALKKAWLSAGAGENRRRATSVSFLIDAKGIIRFVHPGVMYFPSDKPADAEANRDYELIDQAIGALLDEQKAARARD